jgi:hypothetical protein
LQRRRQRQRRRHQRRRPQQQQQQRRQRVLQLDVGGTQHWPLSTAATSVGASTHVQSRFSAARIGGLPGGCAAVTQSGTGQRAQQPALGAAGARRSI